MTDQQREAVFLAAIQCLLSAAFGGFLVCMWAFHALYCLYAAGIW